MNSRWEQLSLREKSQLLGIYASKGYTDLASIISHYNSFAKGGHLFNDGGNDDNKIFVASQASETGWMPEVNVVANKPSWQQGLTDYDWARARRYYSNPDGTINSRGMMFLKDVASKRRTGQSNYMRDVNKLSYIPNAAMLTAGAFSGALTNPYLWSSLGLASGAQNIEDKDYGEAALDIGLTTLGPTVQLINKGIEATKLGKTIRLAKEIRKATNKTNLSTPVIENPNHFKFVINDKTKELTPNIEKAYQQALLLRKQNRPIAFVHEAEIEPLMEIIKSFNGKKGSPSLGIARINNDGNAITGYGDVRFYFPEDYIKSLKTLSWSDDALTPTTRDAIIEAERRGTKLDYTEDGLALIDPKLESEMKASLLDDNIHYSKADKDLLTSIERIREINSPSFYGEVLPLEPVDLSKALYVQTKETYPTLINWFNKNNIKFGKESPQIQGINVGFRNGGKLNGR